MPVTRSVLRRAVAAIALASGLALAACGGGSDDVLNGLPTIIVGPGANGIESLPADEALRETRESLESVSSFRVRGSSISGGPIDLDFLRDVGSTGVVHSGGSPVEVIAVDGQVYVKGDDAFISRNVSKDAVKTISGKWLLLPPDSTSGFAIFADGSRFAAELLDPPGKVERTKMAQVDGMQAIGIVFTETGEQVWVAARGEPLPIRFEEKGASGELGVLRFLDYGKPLEIAAPPADQVVDLTKIPTPTPTPTPSS